jgi:hypothetical protein
MAQGPKQDKYRQKGTRAGKMADRKEDRDGERDKGTKKKCNMCRSEQ